VARGFIKWFGYIYQVAKSVGFSFGQKKKQIKTKSFSSARIRKSVGFPERTTHSFDVVCNLRNLFIIPIFGTFELN
tara:strand:- start:729 stop:956 length:228 start_codon:yes stop_codon:yes gene_type:complete